MNGFFRPTECLPSNWHSSQVRQIVFPVNFICVKFMLQTIRSSPCTASLNGMYLDRALNRI